MRKFTTAIVGASVVSLLPAAAATYDLGPSNGSRFALEVYKTRLMAGKKHAFVFERYGGELVFDPLKPEDAKVTFTLEAPSVVCTDTWVNDGSRRKIQATARDQMMQADRYPRLTFISSRVTVKGEGQYDVEGMLTIRDRTRSVVVHVSMKDCALEGSARLKLSDFGLKPPKGVTLGLMGTKDEMAVIFRLAGRP
jgi:polyisoprenoid-binding protein YceI